MNQNNDIKILQDTIQRWKERCEQLEERIEELAQSNGTVTRLESELRNVRTMHELLNQRWQKTDSMNKELRQTIKQLQAVIDYLLNKNKGGR